MNLLRLFKKTAKNNGPWARCAAVILAATGSISGVAIAKDNQSKLQPFINAPSQKTLTFDWPILKVGTGEYTEGPTGVTVLHFDKHVLVAADVRGGGPGTVNTDYMALGYDIAELDTVVFAGGSWYGLEAVTAVASALKDDGIRDGNAFGADANIAMSVGSIIFDFGGRRLNEIYPDKKLAQAAFRAAKTGEFPLGAHGAGRFAKSGGFFGCNAFSGQGGAFRQIGDVKVAAFIIANPYGVITDRDGNPAACFGGKDWPENISTADLMQNFPESLGADWKGPASGASNKNTTVSLIVTNQKLSPADLKRLAVQVHTSLGRGIQPFATQFDGDVLYAVSTQELEEQAFSSPALGVIASEVMWDALLSSVPEQPTAPTPAEGPLHSAEDLAAFVGEYKFSQFVDVQVTANGNKLYAQATGKRRAFAITKDKPTELLAVSKTEFTILGRYPLSIHFDGKGAMTFNPGHWQQVGKRGVGGSNSN